MRVFFHDVLLLKGMSLKKIIFLNFTSLSESRDTSAQHTKAPWFERAQIPAMVLSGKASGVKKKKKSAKTNVWIHLLWGPLVNKGTAERRFGSSDTVTVLLWPNSNPNLIFLKNTEEKSSKYFISSRFCLFNDYSSTSVYTLICTHLVYYLLIQVGWPRFIPPAPLTG